MTPDLWSFIWRWQQSHSPSSGHQQISAWPLLPKMRRDLPCHFDHVEVPVSPVLTSVPVAVSAAAFFNQINQLLVCQLPEALFLSRKELAMRQSPESPAAWAAPHPLSLPQAPHIPQGSPTTPTGSRAKCKRHLKAPQEQAATKECEKGLSFPLAVRFCVTAQRKATQNYILSRFFHSSTFTSPSRSHLFLFKRRSHPIEVSRTLLVLQAKHAYAWIQLIFTEGSFGIGFWLHHLCQRVVPYCICGQRDQRGLFPREKDGKRLQI